MNVINKLSRNAIPLTAILTVFLLTACSVVVESEPEGTSAALIERLPAGASAVAWIDFEALAEAMTEEDWTEYEEMFQDDEDMQDLQRFTDATGIDLREDMRRLAFVALPGETEDGEFLVLLSAEFEEDRVIGLTEGAETTSYEGVTFYDAETVFANLEEAVGRSEPEPDQQMGVDVDVENPGWIAILDDQTLGLGSEAGLQIAVDVPAGRRDALSSDVAMNGLVAQVADEGQIWFVANRDSWRDRVDDLGQGGAMVPTNAIESIEVMTMSMRLGDGMTLRLTGTTATAEAATELTTSVNGLLAMGRMMIQQSEPELFAIVDRGLRVSQDDRTILIQADLTEEDIEVLQRMAEEQMPER